MVHRVSASNQQRRIAKVISCTRDQVCCVRSSKSINLWPSFLKSPIRSTYYNELSSHKPTTSCSALLSRIPTFLIQLRRSSSCPEKVIRRCLSSPSAAFTPLEYRLCTMLSASLEISNCISMTQTFRRMIVCYRQIIHPCVRSNKPHSANPAAL